MELKPKSISKNGIAAAISKAELYRYLNEPEESESICHDILASDPENQLAMRLLGLAITDQFTGTASDRYSEAEATFKGLSDPYEREYYLGLLTERRAKAEMRAGRPGHSVHALLQEAMKHFEAAEKIRPTENDDAVLRWNRCLRLLEKLPQIEWPEQQETFEDHDVSPVASSRRSARAAK